MQFLARLATVVVRPRATMARILETPPRAQTIWLLFALATISGIFGDFDAPALQQMLQQSKGVQVAAIVAAAMIGVVIVVSVVLWFYTYVPFFAGRFLCWTGDIRGVRAALAWGLAPAIWALLYRIPTAFWVTSSSATVRMRNGNVAFDPGRLAEGCGTALILGTIELAVFVWCIAVMSNTVGEAHRFSAWHGLGTLAIAAIAPIVVVLAAVLAMM